MTFVQSDEVTWPDQKKHLRHLRQWLQYWQLRTWINDNLCYPTVNCDIRQHSQLLFLMYRLLNFFKPYINFLTHTFTSYPILIYLTHTFGPHLNHNVLEWMKPKAGALTPRWWVGGEPWRRRGRWRGPLLQNNFKEANKSLVNYPIIHAIIRFVRQLERCPIKLFKIGDIVFLTNIFHQNQFCTCLLIAWIFEIRTICLV